MKVLSIASFTLLLFFGNAQNLVPNPSFESTADNFCGIMSAGDFDVSVDDWYSPSLGTPDCFFDNIAPSCWNYQPTSTYGGPIGLKGEQLPRTGNVMSGLFTYTIPGFEDREYLQIQLSSPLTPGANMWLNATFLWLISPNLQPTS